MKTALLIAVAFLCFSVTQSPAFTDINLAAFARQVEATLAPGFRTREIRRDGISFYCQSCEQPTLIVVDVTRRPPRDFERLRSGVLSLDQIEAQCRARQPSCFLERADIADVMGLVTGVSAEPIAGVSLMLMRADSFMVVKSSAPTMQEARTNLDRLRRDVLPQFVSR
jgi:hypothetical protein